MGYGKNLKFLECFVCVMNKTMEVEPIELLEIDLQAAVSTYHLSGVRYGKWIFRLENRRPHDGWYKFDRGIEYIEIRLDAPLRQVADPKLGGVWDLIDDRYVKT